MTNSCHLGVAACRQQYDVLLAAADVLWRGGLAVLGNQRTPGNEMFACGLAIEADFHHAASALKIGQNAPDAPLHDAVFSL